MSARLGRRGRLLVVSIGLLSAAMTYTLLAASSSNVRQRLSPPQASGCIGIIAALMSVTLGTRYRQRNTPPGRCRRLKQMLQSPGGIQRFPHRGVELAFRSQTRISEAVRQATSQCTHGLIIVVNGPTTTELRRMRGAVHPFEPIATSDLEALHNLLRSAPDADAGCDDAAASIRKWREQTSESFVAQAILLVLGLLLVYLPFRAGQYWASALALLLIFGLLFSGFFKTEEWWLVPGGMIREDNRLLSRRARIERFDAAGGCLLISSRERGSPFAEISVCSGGRVRGVTRARWRQPVLLAWLSPLAPPTDQQLLELFTGRGDRPEPMNRR